MIVMFSDFGLSGPYIGQVEAVLFANAPGVPVVQLFTDAPAYQPRLSAYLLAGYQQYFPKDSVFLCVIDPGVGDPARRCAIVRADDCWYVGPDNGLFNVIARRATTLQWWDITWQPQELSASFHGRDLFAPVAAMLAMGEMPTAEEVDPSHRVLPGWSEELPTIIYIDHYGNCITGIRFRSLNDGDFVRVHNQALRRARTFSDCHPGEAFFYENSNGLLEIAVNQGSASDSLGLKIGDMINVVGIV